LKTIDESEAVKPRVIDRSTWGSGPWDGEPDRVDFRTFDGFAALALRQPMGHWCGYVAVPPGHPAHGSKDDCIVDVHGGVTYASECAGNVCHVPDDGEPADVWWIGFDFSHAYDLIPSTNAAFATLMGSGSRNRDVYRDLTYVRAECEIVGRQLQDMANAERKP
jgi:hypothetical protein